MILVLNRFKYNFIVLRFNYLIMNQSCIRLKFFFSLFPFSFFFFPLNIFLFKYLFEVHQYKLVHPQEIGTLLFLHGVAILIIFLLKNFNCFFYGLLGKTYPYEKAAEKFN